MSTDPLRTFIEATDPRPEQLDAARAGLVERGVLAGETGRAIARFTARSPGLARRLLERAGHRRAVLRLGFAGAMLAGAALVALRLVPSPPSDHPLEWALAPADPSSPVRPTPEIALRPEGYGHLTGTATNATLAWESGTVEVSVEPGRGIAFTTLTREAEVAVTGTIFAVTRDVRGTRVGVRRGQVRVRCLADGNDVLVDPGQDRLCDPVSAAGLLGRLRRQQDEGAAPSALLPGIESALRIADHGSPVATELEVMRVLVLRDLGRREEACDAAKAYLALPDAPRREQVGRVLDECAPTR